MTEIRYGSAESGLGYNDLTVISFPDDNRYGHPIIARIVNDASEEDSEYREVEIYSVEQAQALRHALDKLIVDKA